MTLNTSQLVLNTLRVRRWMQGQHPAGVFTLLILLCGLITWLDDYTGAEWSIFVLYAIPIVLGTWWRGISYGMLFAGLSGYAWWWANADTNLYQTIPGYMLATFSRSVFFAVSAVAAVAILRQQEADQVRIQLLEERRQLEHDLVAVSEHEQQRIGQDLHDGLCQQLAAIGCAAKALADDLRAGGLAHASDAEQIEDALSDAISHARGLARGVFPIHVDESGLYVALSELVSFTQRLTGMKITLVQESEVTVQQPEVGMHIYRIVQEALSNAIRHSGGTEVKVHLQQTSLTLTIRVTDNGIGFEPSSLRDGHGMGLRTMHYRAQTAGASLDIESAPRSGTSVILNLETYKLLPTPYGIT